MTDPLNEHLPPEEKESLLREIYTLLARLEQQEAKYPQHAEIWQMEVEGCLAVAEFVKTGDLKAKQRGDYLISEARRLLNEKLGRL